MKQQGSDFLQSEQMITFQSTGEHSVFNTSFKMDRSWMIFFLLKDIRKFAWHAGGPRPMFDLGS